MFRLIYRKLYIVEDVRVVMGDDDDDDDDDEMIDYYWTRSGFIHMSRPIIRTKTYIV
jgi:hypothetical protein